MTRTNRPLVTRSGLYGEDERVPADAARCPGCDEPYWLGGPSVCPECGTVLVRWAEAS